MKKQTPVYETEVLVAGAGPSGCATALSLLNYSDKEVMLIEQSDLNNTRVGEQVSATIFKFIDYLKLTQEDFHQSNHMPSYNSISYWGSNNPSTRDAIFTTEESTYQLNREEFDLALLKKVSDLGGIILPRTKVQDITQNQDGRWELNLIHATEGPLKVITTYLVDATGRNASLSRQLNIHMQKHDKLMGVGCFLSAPENQQQAYGHIIESCKDGWWYCAHLPDNKIVVSLFSDADIISSKRLNQTKQWQNQLSQTQHIANYIKGAKLDTEKPWVRNACSQILNGKLPNNFVAVGDAVCGFDPISSMGIGFALSSGCQAAITILHNDRGSLEKVFSLYQQDLQHIFNEYQTTHNKIYDKEQRWKHSEFWQRRNKHTETVSK
jgi:flavin-dependent dehydrogenase